MPDLRQKVQNFRNDSLNLIKSVDNNFSVDSNGKLHLVNVPSGENIIGSVDSDFSIDSNGKLHLEKATAVQQDNTKPITSAAVYTEIGNIEALLAAL